MKHQASLRVLIPIIFLLSLFAAAMGLFYQAPGEPYAYTTLRGEKVTINGHGLYFYDTVSSAAQMQANDFIALVLGLPLLGISTWLAYRSRPGSANQLRGQLLLTGTLGFFLYTYMSMAFNTAINALFTVYVALFSLSLYAFILAMLSFDLPALPGRFSERLPRGWIAGLLIAAGVFLLLAWMGGRILPTLQPGSIPALENTTTMVIQAMDLGLIMPLAFLGAVLLLRRSAWGYLLSSVAVMKMVTMGAAVSAMGINMILAGTPDSPVLLIIFLALTAINLVLAVLLLRSIQNAQVVRPSVGMAPKKRVTKPA